MQIGMVITPLDESNLRLASQIGVTDVVDRFRGERREDIEAVQRKCEAAGLRLSVIEGELPMERTVLGREGRDEEIERIKTLLQNMGAAGVTTLCYNAMSILDATRTRFDVPVRGGALGTGFDIGELPEEPLMTPDTQTADQFWQNLEYFLRAVLPTAEQAGVRLAMHPDDPPGLATLHGQPRIMGCVEDFERLVNLVPSPSSGICFCQGCFSEMGVDVPETIRRLGRHIYFVHVRDVIGCSPKFRESFHDCGQTDMAAAMRAYREIGFDGVMRPDHVPMLEGETGENSGYTMPGRLFAVGYMRGLMHATAL